MESKAVLLVAALLLLSSFVVTNGASAEASSAGIGPLLVTKENRKTLASTDAGNITAVDVRDGYRGTYHLQFITMKPSTLFLPVLLHADAVLYVHSGSGRVSYFSEEDSDKTEHVDVEHGDIYRLEKGDVFYVESSPAPAREELSIHVIFNVEDAENTKELSLAAYSSVSDLVRDFDDRVLQKTFGAAEETIKAIKREENPPPIVAYRHMNEMETPNWGERLFGTLRGIRMPANDDIFNKKKKKKKESDKKGAFNFYKAKRDYENCNGWTTALSSKGLKDMKNSGFGAFMVNLNKGSMVGPHWNPSATEIDVVINGNGVVQVGCASKASGESDDSIRCEEATFRVKEGDLLVVPKFRPVSQIAYNNGSLVFVGLSTHAAGKSSPQFLAGKKSFLQNIDREILAMAFNVRKVTITDLLLSLGEPMLLECTSCAEELDRKMEEQPQREEHRGDDEEEKEKGRGGEPEEGEAEPAEREEEEEEPREREQGGEEEEERAASETEDRARGQGRN